MASLMEQLREKLVEELGPYKEFPGVLKKIWEDPEGSLKVGGRGETEAFIIGGGEIFRQTFDIAERIYLTIVHATFQATVFFPEFDPSAWTEIECSHHTIDQKHHFPFTFKTLIRETEILSSSIDKTV